ncbi:septum formation inhibitor Maf [Tenacibaculum amylolyticum]|uniref:septum formation inhibitor Maf n=1 Tax=Tenacibaculum amylolyticum TaxID=104269 RepID=UPI0038942F71
MKSTKPIYSYLFFLIAVFTFTGINSCKNSNATESNRSIVPNHINSTQKRTVSEAAKKYWFDGKAEISSYQLNQIRYGEIHKGTAALIFVTEPFSKESNTKADYDNDKNIPVLKLNTTKKFNTGIYPYSMMNSTFFPFESESSSIKIASSMQEWCGMTFIEMKNKGDFLFSFNSYFEGNSFKDKKITKAILEDDLWSLIRLNPELLPAGKQRIIPGMFYLNLMHKDFKSYETVITSTINEDNTIYNITYPELNRTLSIQYKTEFPHNILSWKETYISGYGTNKKTLTTEATLINSIKVDYWNKNQNKDSYLRNTLGL